MSSYRAQRLLTLVGVQLAPAATAAAVTYHHVGVGAAALVTVGVLGCSSAMEARRYPFHLMPLGGALARALAPLAGFAGAWALSLTMAPIAAEALIVPLLATWLVLALSLALISRTESALAIRVAVVGSPELAAGLAEELELLDQRRWRIVGWIDFTDDGLAPSADGPPRLGFADETEAIIAERGIDLLVFGVRESERESGERTGVSSIGVLERIAEVCVGIDVRVIGANQFFEEAFGHVPMAAINVAWFQYVMHPRFRATPRAAKRLLDIVLAAAVGLAAAPVFAVAALAVKLNDRGPILFRQQRVGREGREFELIKLRTMAVGSERRRKPRWSSWDDPRLTRVGRLLRASHIDELPQIWNVLRGEMSMVGPRPEQPEFVRELERSVPFYDRRGLLKPGLTGWAQVSCGYAGSPTGSVFKLSYDLFYLKHRSAIFDLLIVVETLITPLRDARRSAVKRGERMMVPRHLRSALDPNALDPEALNRVFSEPAVVPRRESGEPGPPAPVAPEPAAAEPVAPEPVAREPGPPGPVA